MSTILLPALRKPWHNLFRYSTGGVQSVRSGTFAFFGQASGELIAGSDVTGILLANTGLAVGDVISARAHVSYTAVSQTLRLDLIFYDSGGSEISRTTSTSVATPTSFVEREIAGATIPASCTHIALAAVGSGGSGTCAIRAAMINKASTVATYETPKRGAVAPWVQAAFSRDNLQAQQLSNAGVSQITTWPSRRWLSQFDTHVLAGDELREWALALDQLSDLNNVCRLVPPRYTGPSAGYVGPNPLVNGASQLGTSLVCDGVEAASGFIIVKAGDYASFDVTSPLGNANTQLFKIAADAACDGSGNVTLTLTTPIRLSPANNAVVQIFSPTAQMALVAPSAGVDYQRLRRAALQVAAEERIWP